ncbi:synaptic vesicle membrane protein VAT-1 homolog-like [Culicoides brevitarsis]|uniref:synaptic vesicle membrane protein VAT-1 homolog-like n=1 Tax=Culicoides brevitarsis TaxID=469753 RepID=UPI00307C5959
MPETKEEVAPEAVAEKTPTEEVAAATNGADTNGHGDEAAAATNGDSSEKSDDKKEEKKEDPPKEMRAIVLTGFGGFKGVKILKKPEPTPAAGEVLIRVRACGLNFQDLLVRLGAIDSPPKTPCILGFECAGEVEAVGEGVEDFKVGDRVVALPEYRAWAELCAVSTKFVYKLPDELSFQDAAAILMNYLVAYIILFDLISLRPGKSVVVHSAAGGVGHAIAQLARTVDNVTLFGVCSKSKHEAVAGLYDHVIDRADYINEIRKVSSDGVDVVLDCLCGEECNRSYGLLKPMGKYLLYGSSNVVTGETKSFFSVARAWWQVDKVSPIKLFDENKTLSGFNLRHLLHQQQQSDYVRDCVDKVFALWKDGKIKPVVDSTYALEDVSEAMQKMHDRKNVGKLVLDPAMEPKPKPATPAKTKNKKQASEDKAEEKKDKKSKDEKKEDKKEEKQTNGDGDAEKKENGDGDAAKATNGDSNGTEETEEKKESS